MRTLCVCDGDFGHPFTKKGSLRERETSLFPLSLLKRCHCRENRALASLLDGPSVVRQSAWRGKLDLSSKIEPISRTDAPSSQHSG